MLRRLIAVLVAVAAASVGLAVPALADGSGTLFPTEQTCTAGGNCRTPIEWRTDGYGPQVPVLDVAGNPTGATRVAIHRRTLFSVYATAGEYILLGSSSIGTGSADAVVWNPGVVPDTEADTLPAPQYSCNAQRATAGNAGRGALRTRAQELAGAQSISGVGTGYAPCYYLAPTTGIYRAAFYGSAGANGSTDGTPDPSIGTATTTFAQDAGDTSVDAWELDVRDSTTTVTNIAGRVFTYAFAGFTGKNQRPVTMTMYLNTLDGFRYRVNTDGFDPNGFLFYGNRTGFVDSDGTPLNHDVLGTGGAPQSLSSTVGNTGLGVPEYPISLAPLAPETLVALGIPTAPTDPTITNVRYRGQQTATGSYVAKGGSFTFTTGSAGTYQIVLSRTGTSFDPGLSTNRVLRGVVDVAGTYTVPWDGLDNAKSPFPARNGYAVQATLRAGEYHAPMLDVESSVDGGPSITLQNPPDDTCPFTGAASDGTNCTTAFYDDRGYVAANGTTVGVVGGWICDQTTAPFTGALPTAMFADPTTGFNSAGRQRAYGTTANANANQQCPSSGGTLGDAKGLDVWTYFPSQVQTTSLDVLPLPTAPTAVADTATTSVGTALVVPAATGLLANDTGTNVTVTTPSPATPTPTDRGGSVTVAADGSFVYTPPTGFSGTDTFHYRITDDAGQIADSTASITVLPRAADISLTTTAGIATGVTVSSLLTGNGTGMSLLGLGTATHGQVFTAGAGSNLSVRYVPADDFSGTDTFTYTVADELSQTAVGTITVTVRPAATADSATTSIDSALVVDAPGILANDLGVGLSATLVTRPTDGTLTLNPDGSYVYVPSPTHSGTETFTYTATGAGGTSTPATVTILVTPTAPGDAATVNAGSTLTVAARGVLANDHGTGLTVASSTAAQHGDVTVSATGAYTYTPASGYSGPDSFTYTARDASGSTATATVVLTVLPVAAPHARTIDPGPTTFASADLLDGSAGASLAVVGHGDAVHGSVTSAGGGLTYTPESSFSGADTFSYTLRDAAGQEVVQTVTVTVRPTAADDAGTVAANGTLTGASVLANDSGSHLVPTITTSASHGTVAMAADGTYVYVPVAGFSGADSFGYTVTGDGGSATATVTLLVTPSAVDHAVAVASGADLPLSVADLLAGALGTGLTVTGVTVSSATPHGTLASDGSSGWVYTPAAGYSGQETLAYTLRDAHGSTTGATVTITVRPVAVDDTASTTAGTSVGLDVASELLANDLGTGLELAAWTAPAHGTVDRAAGVVTYTPAPGFSGVDQFAYTAVDPRTSAATTATVTVTVVPVAVDDAATTQAGRDVTVDLAADDHGVALTPAIVTAPAHGTVTLVAGGAATYAPAAGFSGTDTFTYRVAGDGGTSRPATVTVLVTPVGADDSATTPADTPWSSAGVPLTGNDLGSGLTVTAHTTPTHGTVTVASDGTWSYTPTAGFSGADSFTYTARDGAGSTTSATVSILVTPTAADDSYTVATNGALTVSAGDGVLANDAGSHLAAALGGGVLPLAHVSGPVHGTLVLAPDGSLSYTPPTGFSGADTFAYTASGDGGAALGVVRIDVTPDAPDDVATTVAGTPLTVPATDGVLVNDQGSGLHVGSTTSPSHGSVTMAADGGYTYTPADGFSGTDTFTYTALDSSASPVTATVTVTVLPAAVDDAATVAGNTTLVVAAADGVLADDLGTSLQVSGHTDPSHGTLTIAADGSYTYAPAAGWSGTDAYTYTATDGEGRSADATVTITVSPLHHDATGVDDARAGTPGKALSLDPTANDVAGDHLTIDRGSLALVDSAGVAASTVTTADGTWRAKADGTLTFTPTAGFAGTARVEYRVLNSGGEAIDAWVAVTYPAATADQAGAAGSTRAAASSDPTDPSRPTRPVDPAHGALASTGTDARAIALGALALLLCGAALVSAARPRRAGGRPPRRARHRA